MFAIDLHAHTRFFHGHRTVGEAFDPIGFGLLVRAARYRGLDGIAVTNHDYYRAFGDHLIPEGLTVIPGIEITTTHGHVLVVGPDPPTAVEPSALTPAEAVELAHDRGCAAVIAHPFRNSTVREADELPFDAIEINGKHPRTRNWVERLAADRDLPMVGGSDAHYPIEVGRAYTWVDVGADRQAVRQPPAGGAVERRTSRSATAEPLTPEAVVEAIRDGRVSAAVDDSPTNRLVRRFYHSIHASKGWLHRPDWETPGVGTPPGEP